MCSHVLRACCAQISYVLLCLRPLCPCLSYLLYIWKVKLQKFLNRKICFYSYKYLEPIWTSMKEFLWKKSTPKDSIIDFRLCFTPILLSLRPYGSRNFEIGSCRQHGFFYFVAVSASVDCFWSIKLMKVNPICPPGYFCLIMPRGEGRHIVPPLPPPPPLPPLHKSW